VYERSNALAELATLLLQDAAQEERAPERVGLLKQAGQHFLAALQTDTAIETLQEARGLDPNDAELLFLLADAYTDAAQLQAADALLDEALPKLEGRRGELALHARRKARLSAQTGDRQKQLGWLVEASKHDKQDGPLQVEVAILAEELQDWDTAERALRTISLMKGESPLPRCELFVRQARIWIVRGDSKRALMFARKAQKEEPDSAQVVVLLQQLGAA
jgi:tetratricopeptide (TPR) repeat protein